MHHAILILTLAVENAEANAPIREQLGHPEQAALDREIARDCRAAILVLSSSAAEISVLRGD